jgi:hypothetical protein
LAVGIGTAGVSAARVGATVVDGGVRLRAVRVGSAAHNAHLVEADVAQETVVVYPASHWRGKEG